MTINDYYELKKRYNALLEENKALKAKIRERLLMLNSEVN